MKKFLLIDANSIIHRSFHALPPFTTPEGKPSGALYGIASILLKIWRESRPDYAAALFDRPEPTFRDKKYAEYKAQRPPAADELIAQIIAAHELFNAFGVKTFEKPGFEADDLIATLAEKFKTENDLQVVILTGDRDTLQLVENAKVVVMTFNKGVSDTTIYDEAAVIAKYGLAPAQLIDYKAFVGDASDNIKGVPGVGPKTATELIQKFGTVEHLYEILGRDPESEPKLAARVGPYRKEAELSRELVTLERNVPMEIPPLAELATQETPEGVENYFKAMGFVTLLKRFANGVGAGDEGGSPARAGKRRARKGLPPARPPEDGPKSVQGTIF
ncbi:MAG TPA: 5'-3' exonuclease H3TH domain-containing protein [Candidatus Paceibacterota bacterium]|jgi:DNA polymerase-1|nr:5'-3' exonuclease H3TH domain-containing protein [Candidatus Paceibacterota bacterium]